MSRGGVHADLADVPADELLHRPRGVDAVTGAAVWTAHLTAYGALAEVGRLAPGDHAVITAASSPVGLAAVRTARRLGAIPIALTRTGATAERLRAAGAAEVVATDEGGAADRVLELTGGRGAAVVLDPVASPALAETARTVAPGGTLVVYGWLAGPAPLPMNWPLNIHGFAVDHITDHPDRFRRARAFIESGLASGALVPDVDRVFDLADMARAHHHLESGARFGKVVVTVDH
ncbi:MULTISPECIES: zinc-binding dehydrogenase [unclassified Nocardiopsis]|uniref:zinc-binding dehydrogenase n=1 Tax=Nocardiopsis TaxID=2013 RepID=UPI00387B9129